MSQIKPLPVPSCTSSVPTRLYQCMPSSSTVSETDRNYDQYYNKVRVLGSAYLKLTIETTEVEAFSNTARLVPSSIMDDRAGRTANAAERIDVTPVVSSTSRLLYETPASYARQLTCKPERVERRLHWTILGRSCPQEHDILLLRTPNAPLPSITKLRLQNPTAVAFSTSLLACCVISGLIIKGKTHIYTPWKREARSIPLRT